MQWLIDMTNSIWFYIIGIVVLLGLGGLLIVLRNRQPED
jgi:LPXTG-motif cell wall-anchored protein